MSSSNGSSSKAGEALQAGASQPSAMAPAGRSKRGKKLLRRLLPRSIFRGQQAATPMGRRESVNPLARAAHEAVLISQRSLKVGAPGVDAGPSRTVRLAGGVENEGFPDNSIRTAKYNVATFLPIFLFEVFSRVAYLYFLIQACLSWWSVVSPFGGFGSTAALVVVVLVAAIKAIAEDYTRHREDRRTNNSVAHLLQPDGSTRDITWAEVRVGHVLQVRDDELFPADLLCLFSGLPDQLAFIRTTNLDGESNLKIRKPLDLRECAPAGAKDVTAMRASLTCELPNPNLHQFNGRFVLEEGPSGGCRGKVLPVTMNEMLLRGCMLKNTGYALGLVVYTGAETRIQMNAAKTPNKIGSFDRFLNIQIGLLILVQLALCIFCAVASYIWREHLGRDRYYLAFSSYTQGNYSSGFVYVLILFITFWILYSYLVPISLFVTLEIVKFWQAFVYINRDPFMMWGGETARARNSNLNEDLGKVEYIFSDKTGTLTANEMQLRQIALKGRAFGDVNFKLEEHPEVRGMEALERWAPALARAAAAVTDMGLLPALLASGGSSAPVLGLPTSTPDAATFNRLVGSGSAGDLGGLGSPERESFNEDDGEDPETTATAVLGCHMLDFWINICVCHSLIVEKGPDGKQPIYQGPSPDEVALVEGGRQLGFEFVSRTLQGLKLNILGSPVEYEVLNVMEFTSERGRMSVIMRAPDGTIRLFCKGADSKMLAILRQGTDPQLLAATNQNLHLFATEGLRTLVLGVRILEDEEYAAWDARYQEAAARLEGRDAALAALATEVEAGLDLVGCTAIEDKLQEGVPEAIQSLLDAGMKVWVITGDKQETAINIAISCRLIRHPDKLLICNADSADAARVRLQSLLDSLDTADPQPASTAAASHPQKPELVIDGGTLSHVLGNPSQQLLARLGARCGSVVICRASPAQKAAIVRLMSKYVLDGAVRGATGLRAWLRRHERRLKGKMLAIGDGANDVAMIQAADVGIGVMGKEGRQAVNNSDYAIAQFRFLVRLLLVHGTLCTYRLSRLIKYSFYKNVAFAFILFFYQFYNGFSGQALVDDISAAAYNVVFTSLPIGFFAVLDRPVRHFSTLLRYPQVYNKGNSLGTSVFWRNGVLLPMADAAVCFFFSYYAIAPSGQNSITDVYSMGKVVFIALLGVVTLEVLLVARYWTKLFLIVAFLSYVLVYPFEMAFQGITVWWDIYDPGQYGVAPRVFGSATFWFLQLLIYAAAFGARYLMRAQVWLFRPSDTMVLQEREILDGPSPVGEATFRRLELLGAPPPELPGGAAAARRPGTRDSGLPILNGAVLRSDQVETEMTATARPPPPRLPSSIPPFQKFTSA